MRQSAFGVLLCLFLAGVTRASRVELEAFASGLDSVPIAVIAFKAAGAPLGENDPGKVVSADLSFSPRFRVIDAPAVDSALFAASRIVVYVDGEYRVEENNVVLDCYVRDVGTGTILLGRKYDGDIKHVRGMAHRFCNQLIESLFGDKGMFESRILHVRTDVSGNKDIYLMDYDGYNLRRITNTKTVNIFPAWVDSAAIMWVSYMRGKPDIYRGSLLGGGPPTAIVASRAVQTSPHVNLIEGRLVYSSSKPGNMEIFSAALDGTDVKQLTFRSGIDTSPCWSPTGYQVAFTSDRSGQPQIYVMDADGTNTRRLTFEGSYQDSPAWSPRGDRIAYSSYQNGKFDIWTIAADGSDPRRLTSNPGNNEYPSWSPDGAHVVYMSRKGSGSDLYMIRADGSGMRRVTKSGDAAMPEWGSN